MIVGIDIGGTTTDAVTLDNGEVHVVTIEANDPVAAAAGALGKLVENFNLALDKISHVAATGAGSRVLGDRLFGLPVVKVNEFDAIGIGGTSLAEKSRALVVSLGTGTAIVSVNGEKIDHVSGTGLGGGTLRGLARHMLGVSSLETLQSMAERGDLTRVDLTVRDIAGGAIGDLPPGTTAANFGKITADATAEDKALAIMNMIVEVVSVLSIASRARMRPGGYRPDRQADAYFSIHAADEAAQLCLRPRLRDSRARRLRDRDRRRARRDETIGAVGARGFSSRRRRPPQRFLFAAASTIAVIARQSRICE